MEDATDRVKAIQDKWRTEYDKTVPSKLNQLQSLIETMKSSPNEDALKALRMDVHKIAGSAGTVGYMPVSIICKEWDQDLQKKLEYFKTNPPEASWIPPFEDYLKRVKEGFSRANTLS